MSHRPLTRFATAATALLVLAAGLFAWSPPAHAALLPGTPNNPWPDGCALKLGVSIDRSNSILDDSPANPGLIRQALAGLVEGLAGSGMEVGVWSFGTAASGYVGPNPLGPDPTWSIGPADYPSIGFTSTDTPAGRLAIADTVDAIPFASESSPEDQRTKGWTNWEAGLGGAASGYVTPGATAPDGDTPADADLVVVVTDGSPTAPGPPSLGWSPDDPVNQGVLAADALKAPGSPRIVAIGVGSAVDVANLERITGGLGTSQPDDDYYSIADYDELLGTLLASVASSCGGTALARKYQLVPGEGSAAWEPSSGRSFQIAFDREPPSLQPPATSGTTDVDGELAWSWVGDGEPYEVSLSESLLPAERLWGSRCRLRPSGGGPGPWTDLDRASVSVTVPNAEALECEWFNYVANPRLSLVKEADPTRVHEPEGSVTFRVEVSNTSPSGLERIRVDSLQDDRFGDLLDPAGSGVTSNDCPSLAGLVLEPGSVVACTFVGVVSGDVSHPHVDVVTVLGTEVLTGGGAGLQVSAMDDAEVQFDPVPPPDPPEPPAPRPPAPSPPAPKGPEPRVGSLPRTGSPTLALSFAGASLVTGGAALLSLRRGRASRRS